MKRAAFIGFWAAMSFASSSARAQSNYQAFTVSVDAVGGGRGGAGTDDAILGGGRLSVGYRWTQVRVGVVGGALYSRTFDSGAIDFGAYVSADLVSIWLDPTLAIAAFVRLDLLGRDVPSVGSMGFVPEASIGLRVFGISLSFAGGVEIGLALAPVTPLRLGGTGEARLGVEIVELVQFFKHLAAEKTPTPP